MTGSMSALEPVLSDSGLWPSSLDATLLAKAKLVKLLLLDVDGVLTDGRLFFDAHGMEYKSFHARDGHGIKLLQRSGVQVGVISGRDSPIVALRMHNLGVELVYQGHEHKVAAFEEILQRTGLLPEQVAFLGDDVLDLPIMLRVGLAMAVSDAHVSVKHYAHGTTSSMGGLGAVREVCDLLMHAQGTYAAMLNQYLAC